MGVTDEVKVKHSPADSLITRCGPVRCFTLLHHSITPSLHYSIQIERYIGQTGIWWHKMGTEAMTLKTVQQIVDCVDAALCVNAG